jgi:phospholipid transport system substrate-binding protein
MTREIAGAYWNRLNDDQKNRLVAAFSRFETAIFADWFDSFAGQTFQVTDKVTRNDDIATIGVALSATPDPLRLEYVLRADASGAWRISDIRYEGWMSTVERRHSEFTELFEHEGYDVVMARLEAKSVELLNHPDSANSTHLREPIRDLWSISFVPVF